MALPKRSSQINLVKDSRQLIEDLKMESHYESKISTNHDANDCWHLQKEMEPVCSTHEKQKEMLGKYKC